MCMVKKIKEYSKEDEFVNIRYIKTIKRHFFRRIYPVTSEIEISFAMDEYENCFAFFINGGDGLLFELSDHDYTMMLACVLITIFAKSHPSLLEMKEDASKKFLSLLGACMEKAA